MRHTFLISLVALSACSYQDMAPTGPYYDTTAATATSGDLLEPEVTPGEVATNPWVYTVDETLSTFSADVDSASYTLTRRALNDGTAVDPETVRVEEFMNYFHYDTEAPAPGDDLPFHVNLEAGPSVFGHAADVQMLRIALQAEQIPVEERDPVNLVFLLDVSGSMSSSDKLGLVKYSMNQLVDKLSPEDTLGIVVYAGAEGVVLEPTAVKNKSKILDALDALSAGGSTNGQAGLKRAYSLAADAFREDGVNRVVLCSDGDMNVGATGQELIDLLVRNKQDGIFLTTLGFGTGNFQDETMEQMADQADGNYAYIDSQNEALRVLGENLVSTLQVVAKDTKLQVEFNPETVEAWRLIGYENRLLEHHEFDDDAVDAGDIGAGHHVTALYELQMMPDAPEGELANVAIRYKEPTATSSTEHLWSLNTSSLVGADSLSDDMRFVMATAEFAEILRGSIHSEGERYQEIVDLAANARPAETRTAMQAEFLELVRKASQR